MDKLKCEICDNYFSKSSGHFTLHLLECHKMTFEDYVVKTKYNNIHPKCQCGFCDENAPFYRGKFRNKIKDHKKFDWVKEQKLKLGEHSTCLTCGNEINWNRGNPNKYCSFKCLPNRWNQDKIKNGIIEKYGVTNVAQIPDVKEKVKIKLDLIRGEMIIKSKETKILKYENGAFDTKKFKMTMIKNHGVDHPSKMSKNREKSSNRMKYENPMFDIKIVEKNVNTHMGNIRSGKTKQYNSSSYNDRLYYQSSYEKHFLDLCSEINILDKVENGHCYNYIENDKDFGYRILTDFTINDMEIEIKSKWILEKQGGLPLLEAKRRAVESNGKKYLLILDKDYTEFLKIIIKG